MSECDSNTVHNAIYYLQRMPREGSNQLLIEACSALGLDVNAGSECYSVLFQGNLVGTIKADVLILNMESATLLEKCMPGVSYPQGKAFDRVLGELERDRIAVHEAGHAIVGLRFGFDLVHVKLDHEGHSEVDFSLNPIDDDECTWTNEQLRQHQQCYAAGAAAERVVFQQEREHGKKRDICCHKKLEKRLNQSRTSGFEEDIRAAMELLDKSLIEKVATALKQRGLLDHDEVAKLIDYEPTCE